MADKDKEKDRKGGALARWDPFGELDLFESFGPLAEMRWPRLSRLMEEMWGGRAGSAGLGLAPAMDVTENDDSYVVSLELPGVAKEDVSVELHDDLLTIRGEKKSEREEKKERRRWVERRYGSFSRSFTLPRNAAGDRVNASFKDGVLTLTIPKSEESKPKTVKITS
jgi:HSP20 family protein